MIRAPPDRRKSPGAPEACMAIQLALMIEGQEGLAWDRWRALAREAEEAGYRAIDDSYVAGRAQRPRPASRAARWSFKNSAWWRTLGGTVMTWAKPRRTSSALTIVSPIQT